MDPVNKTLYNFDTLRNDPDPSRALGRPTAGSIFNAINLPDSQAGYRHHYGVLADKPDKDDWGVLALINQIEAVAAAWRDPTRPCIVPKDNPNPPELFQVGDLSKGTASTRNFGGYWSDHPSSHQNGLDVDLRFIRTDHDTLPLHLDGPSAIYYDRGATADLMWCFLYQPNVILLTVDSVLARVDFENDPRIEHRTDHRDHFHIRIKDPDGTTN